MGEGWRPTPSPPFCQSFHNPVFFSVKQFYIFIIKKLFIMKFTHQVRCYHFLIVGIIAESVNLIQMLQ